MHTSPHTHIMNISKQTHTVTHKHISAHIHTHTHTHTYTYTHSHTHTHTHTHKYDTKECTNIYVDLVEQTKSSYVGSHY